MTNPINISGDVDLERLLTRLSDDIVKAPAFLRLYKDLGTLFGEYEKEANHSHFFWSLTSDAVREVGLIRIARVFDQQEKALSLRTLLLTIQANHHLFEDEAVRKRVHPDYAKEMRPGTHSPDSKDIEAHLRIVTHDDPLVHKIIMWRNTLGAHISPKRLLKWTGEEFDPLTPEDAFNLCDRTFKVFNHYSSLFQGVHYARTVMGEEGSVERVFEYLRLGIDADQKHVEEEFLKWKDAAEKHRK
jgi:hypothetical protein